MSVWGPTATSPRMGWTPRRPRRNLRGRPAHRRKAHLCDGHAQSDQSRNPSGTGQFFAVVNERDEIGPDLVPDYLSIKDGGFYGWPYRGQTRPCRNRISWQQHDTVRGRPVGVALDRTGALLVADDAGNAVWRVSADQSGQ